MNKRRIAAVLVFVGLGSTATAARSETTSNGAYAGAYADDFSSLSTRTRDYDAHPESVFSYCARNTAVYECLSYAADGTIRRNRQKAVLHGTAFAYRHQANDTLLVTNDHVATWPSVTDTIHGVDGIPAGCKLVSQTVALVDNEHDEYPRDDVSATVVVTDSALDVAILRAHGPLQVMPWKIGRSADLRERNVVEVRGFPLGAFRATNIGKVISAHDHDDYGDWDHDDFVIDALLSSGNSGSPVLAVSRATGEYELVGVFHAGYSQGSALNVVIGIDQVRDLMTTLKRAPHEHQDDLFVLDGTARAKLEGALGPPKELFFPFGALVANIRTRPDGALLFVLFSKDFPLTSDPLLVIESAATTRLADFGAPGRVWVGSPRGLKDYEWPALPPDVQAQLSRTFDEIAGDALSYAGLREARESDLQSRQSTDRVVRLGKAFARTAASRADMVQSIGEIAERLGPPSGPNLIHFAQLLAPREVAHDLATVASPAASGSTVAQNAGGANLTSLQH
jgi:S1-C subfamily serine protease